MANLVPALLQTMMQQQEMNQNSARELGAKMSARGAARQDRTIKGLVHDFAMRGDPTPQSIEQFQNEKGLSEDAMFIIMDGYRKVRGKLNSTNVMGKSGRPGVNRSYDTPYPTGSQTYDTDYSDKEKSDAKTQAEIAKMNNAEYLKALAGKTTTTTNAKNKANLQGKIDEANNTDLNTSKINQKINSTKALQNFYEDYGRGKGWSEDEIKKKQGVYIPDNDFMSSLIEFISGEKPSGGNTTPTIPTFTSVQGAQKYIDDNDIKDPKTLAAIDTQLKGLK